MRVDLIWAAVAAPVVVSESLLPIFFMHGVDDNHREFDDMQTWIHEIDPNVTLYSLPVCDDSASYANLWHQGQVIMDRMREQIAASPDVFKDGYSFLAHSQGALTARTVIERMDDHNVHTFIGLAGPQMGEFGIPQLPDGQSLLKKLAAVGKDLVYTLVFEGMQGDAFQKRFSIANFWNDPRGKYGFTHPHQSYLKGNTFLPVLNNDPGRSTQGPSMTRDDVEALRYKRNFMRLQHAVFTAGTADEVIRPYLSGVWEFFDETGENIIPLNESKLWTEDWLGLRALHESDRLTLTAAEGVCHVCWAHDKEVFTSHVAPHLPRRSSISSGMLV